MPKSSRSYALPAALASLLLFCPTAAPAEDGSSDAQRAARLEFFEAKIRPVLVEHCYSCHAADSETIQGGLRVDSRAALLRGGDSGAALEPGKPDGSPLLAALRYEGPEMPPKGKLPDSVVRDFERWIREGAVDPREDAPTTRQPAGIDYESAAEFWAFQRPEAVEPPAVQDGRQVRGEIDRFIQARLEQAGLQPVAPAGPRTLVRRAYLDLVGLPPTPAEVDRFLARCEQDSDAAYAELIDELLQSPHYGERWARRWLDIARYGEDQAHTFKARKYPRGYFYRDWVIRALNDDMPYDRFVAEQVAGDLLPGPDRHERLAALGLFALGPVYYAENVEQAKARADEWDDRVDTLMRGVLGLTVSCARCHDHKYDPIAMRDYYALAGIFASTRYEERPIVADEVLKQRKAADDEVARQQTAIDRFLLAEARAARPALLDHLPRYLRAAQEYLGRHDRKQNGKQRQKAITELAKRQSLSPTLLRQSLSPTLLQRWVDYLASIADTPAEQLGHLAPLKELTSTKPASEEQGENSETAARTVAIAESLQSLIAARLDRREALFRRYGENVAFVKPEDRADVRPGVIPLGNLFDDSPQSTLDAALASDRYQAAAGENSLGIDRVVQGWGTRTEIAPGIKFDFGRLGSDDRQYGGIFNDAWNQGGAIRTAGQPGASGKRVEQGIGMHANALITFDLQEIRRAGLLTADQRFVFRVDRAGLNDDVFGSSGPSAHLAVIVSRPHRDKAVTDAILAGFVNGRPQDIATDDFTYYFAGELPEPLAADGRFVTFDIPLPPEARYLTLVATGAGKPDDNSISGDHTVFSGARLELDPMPEAAAAEVADKAAAGSPEEDAQDLRDARLLSRLFADEGLLGLPAAEVEPHLPADAAETLKAMREELARRTKAAEAIEVPLAHALTEGEPRDLPIYLQGNPAKQGDTAPRGMPAIFTGGEHRPFESDGSGRLELARAIASPDNPLTARVIVNRVWAGHFGYGLVRTPSNFGKLGEPPSHPELLDSLAVRFMEQGWSLKWLHREIMLSAAYRRSSAFHADNYQADPENRLLWRMNRRRLEIEPWRDSLLAVTGELDTAVGGASRDLSDAGNNRRTLYGFISRHKLDELLRLFDFPDPNITSGRRAVTTVPLQQLFVLNSDFMTRRARALAQRIEREAGPDDEPKIRHAYQLLYARSPGDGELRLGLEFLDPAVAAEQADGLSRWEQYALALLSANELLYVD